MLVFLTTFLAILPSILRSRAALELENLALRHQIGVLQRSAAKRPKLTSGDRFLWICLSRLWRDWRAALAIVKPETVVAWHRAGFRLFWTWKVRCGQPSAGLLIGWRPMGTASKRRLFRRQTSVQKHLVTSQSRRLTRLPAARADSLEPRGALSWSERTWSH